MVRAQSLTATLIYTYTADGLRVGQSTSGTLTTYAWDWASPVPELLAQSTGSQSTPYLIGHETLGWAEDGAWRTVLPDALGSVRQVADAVGAVVRVREWEPYGQEVGGLQEGLGYTGEWQDAAVGLVYLRARWYDVATGRFTQRDPWEGNYRHPLTLNDWGYVEGNPLRYVDPAGWYPVELPGEMCQERPCTIHPVVTYIVDRIREDSASEEIKRIRELNESHRYEDAWVECQRMPWWQRLLICPQYLQHALDADIGARNAALVEFGCLVADARLRPVCGQWDYKKEIGENKRLGHNAQRIDFCAIGIDEEVIFYYDIWANIHFGYLGMVGGFSEELLLEGAAIEHMGSNPGQTKDDSSDQVCAKIGIQLYRSALTEEALLMQLYIHRHALNKVRIINGRFEVYQ